MLCLTILVTEGVRHVLHVKGYRIDIGDGRYHLEPAPGGGTIFLLKHFFKQENNFPIYLIMIQEAGDSLS